MPPVLLSASARPVTHLDSYRNMTRPSLSEMDEYEQILRSEVMALENNLTR